MITHRESNKVGVFNTYHSRKQLTIKLPYLCCYAPIAQTLSNSINLPLYTSSFFFFFKSMNTIISLQLLVMNVIRRSPTNRNGHHGWNEVVSCILAWSIMSQGRLFALAVYVRRLVSILPLFHSRQHVHGFFTLIFNLIIQKLFVYRQKEIIQVQNLVL